MEDVLGTFSGNSSWIQVSSPSGKRFYTFYLGTDGYLEYIIWEISSSLIQLPILAELEESFSGVPKREDDVSVIVTDTRLEIRDAEKDWFFNLPSLQEIK